MPIRSFRVGPMDNNTVVIFDEDTKEAVVIDPSMESDIVLEWIRQESLNVGFVINTHGHQDHTYNNALFQKETGAKVMIHPEDEAMLMSANWMDGELSPKPDVFLADGEDLIVGEAHIKVIETPGHTPGSTCFYFDGWVMTGDTLFAGSIGRFDFPGGSAEQLDSSIKEKLFVLPENTIVLPGHGAQSGIGKEIQTNPFVGVNAPPVSTWGNQ